MLVLGVVFLAATTFAKQGVVRNLYTVPNTTFVEQPTGESVVTVNDTTGSISSLQTAINNARSANPTSVIVIRLLRGAVYSVSNAGLTLGSHECLVAEGAVIEAASSSVTVPLITISSGSTNVSVSGGTLDGQGANTNGIFAPSASRVNIDKVVVKNFGSDGILLSGNGNTTFDNEMTVTRSDVSGSSAAGIHIQNSTQTVLLDNNCHDNGTGILVSAAWANIANNTCHNNTTGIDIAGGSDNVVANNTCDSNSTGIHAGAANGMIVSNLLSNNTSAGINSSGTGNNFIDNMFAAGNSTNLISSGTSNNVVPYKTSLSASGQNYFYPPLIDNQHTDTTIVNGMGRTDVTISSTTIDSVQSQYNAALSAHPNNVIVLHLNGTFTVGANALSLSSNTCVLLNGTIQINSSTTASAAVTTSASGQTHISLSGGIIDGGGLTGHNGINMSGASMVQVDGMTLQNFGPSSPRVGGSDVIHFSGGSTPYIVTRCTVNGGAARGIWLQLSGQKSLISDNEVTNVNQDGVDCDSSTFGSVVKFNYCHDLVRYGVFFEQSAKNNLALGNICNNTGRDLNVYNNDTATRPPTQFNTLVSNSCTGNNGIRNGSIGASTVVTSHNFFFNNTILNASILSQPAGTENYYSQNYLSGGTLSTSGVETFFNSADVSGNLQIHDSNSGLAVIVQGASTTDGASVVTAQPNSMGNGSNDDEWQFLPTGNGYYRIVNTKSGLVMAVQGASTADGAAVIQTAYTADGTFNDEWLIQPAGNGLYNIVNRLSGLYLDVSGSSTSPGAQLIQSQSNGAANQQFSLVEDVPSAAPPDFAVAASPATQTVVAGNSASYTATVTPSNGFTGTVALSVSGMPSGVSCGSASVTGGSGSATINCTTTSTTTPGTYTLTITGTSGSLAHSATVSLTVNAPPDFSLSATPSSQTVIQGGSTSYTASVAALNGFTGTVGLSISGLPSGATGTFNPTSITTSGSSTLSVTTSASTPTGTYTLTITGTSGSLSHSQTVSLTVNPPPNFTLAASPASQTVNQGSNTSYTASVSAVNGFTGTVSLNVSGLPTGATGTFNPASITTSGSSTLSVTTLTSTPAGTYTLTITGTSGSLSHSAMVSLTVNALPPDFTLTATPASQTVTQGGSTSYTTNVSAVNGFSGTISLSISGLPTGATGTFNPTSITTSGSSTLSVATSTSTPAGAYTLTITGTSGSLSHSATVSLTVNPITGLPTGWSDSDIGAPGLAGSASFNASTSTFTVNGSGTDIWSTSDNFNYAREALSGDLTITARVASQQNTNAWAKSGVMIRQSAAANDAYVAVYVTPSNGVSMQYRPSTGASAVQLAQQTGHVAPYWVRLVRSGSTFTGFSSADGVSWTQVGTISVTMASNALEGLAVCAHNNTALNTTMFDHVTISAPGAAVTMAPTADAYVRDGTSAATNFGADPTLVVKTSTSGFNRHAFLKFDLSTVSTVSSAKLRVFGNIGGTTGTSPVTAHQVADTTWTESGITWNNQPTIGAAMTTVSVGITGQYWEWDVTSYIQSQKAAGKTSVTLELQNDASTTLVTTFNSREATSNPPQLVVGP